MSSAAGIGAWGKAVIAAVALLAAGIGVAVGGFLVGTRAAAAGAAAGYVPATAPFYVEMRLDPSAGQDAALRELLGRFPPIEGLDLDRPLYAQLGEHVDEMLADESTSLSWGADVDSWFDGRVALAVFEVPLDQLKATGPNAAALAAPPMVLMFGVHDRAAAEAAIERVMAEAPQPPVFEQQSHAGVTIHVAADEGAYALVDDELLVAPRADDIVTALDSHADPDASLAGADGVARYADALPSDWLAFALYDMTDLMAAALDEAGAQSPEMTDALRALIEAQPMSGAVALTAGGDRVAVDAAAPPPGGEFTVANAARDLASEVPADVLYYAEGGNLGASLAATIGPMKASLATDPTVADQIDTFEAALGTNLEDFVSWIGDGAVAAGYDGEAAYGGLVLVPNDVDAAQRRIGQIASFAGLAALDPSSGVSVSESEVESVTVTSIRWTDPDASPEAFGMPLSDGVVFQLAVSDDRALIGIGDTFVTRVLELDRSESLGAADRYRDAVAGLGGPTAASVGWVDLTGIRHAVETVFQPMLAENGVDDAYTSTIQPWLVPLDRFVSVTRLEGETLVQRSALLVE